MSTRFDGGPAFPYVELGVTESGHICTDKTVQGMSLRDWFAGQALVVAGTFRCGHIAAEKDDRTEELTIQRQAKLAYRLADAMIAARQIRPDSDS